MLVSWDPQIAAAVIRTGVESAERAGAPMALAIVDAGGRLVAFGRTRDATAAAVDCAPAKARTAVWFDRPTEETVEVAQRRPEVYQSLIAASPQPLVLSMGGLPMRHEDGSLVGAVGAAGARLGATDIEVAEAMLTAWQSIQRPTA